MYVGYFYFGIVCVSHIKWVNSKQTDRESFRQTVAQPVPIVVYKQQKQHQQQHYSVNNEFPFYSQRQLNEWIFVAIFFIWWIFVYVCKGVWVCVCTPDSMNERRLDVCVCVDGWMDGLDCLNNILFFIIEIWRGLPCDVGAHINFYLFSVSKKKKIETAKQQQEKQQSE